MNETAKQILSIIEQFITENPQQRFTQALFNLGITEFADRITRAKDGMCCAIFITTPMMWSWKELQNEEEI